MPNRRERLLPCAMCRERHLKCNGESPCLHCQKSGLSCVRPTKRFRFKKSKHDKSLSFSAGQTWIRTRSRVLSYVDETEQIIRGFESMNDTNDTEYEKEAFLRSPQSLVHLDHESSVTATSPDSTPNSADSFQHSSYSSLVNGPLILYSQHIQASPSADPQSFQTDVYSACDPCPNNAGIAISVPILNSNHGKPNEATHVGLQEACLMRHFIQNLAHSFDTTDRDCHFTLTIPQRAMYNPVLLYAVCTASARHLTRLWHKNHSNNVIKCNGIPLPELDEHSAIHYHNLCISYLIDFSKDPLQSPSEEALAAATILRFYEQIDAPLTGLDAETYLNVVQTVINSQQTETLYSIPSVQETFKNNDTHAIQTNGLRFSAHLIALRQEIWSVLLYRRPFRLPLCPENDYQHLPPADEFIWVNRILIWCGDVVRFCFGTDYIHETTTSKPKTKAEQWQAMKAFEESWSTLQPTCFKALYSSPAKPECGKFFPDIWQMNDCQTLGIQHIEIGRMLLLVYDPRRQLLGIGSSATNQELETKIRHSVLRLCGLASSNKRFQAGMTTAAVGVSLFGESFHDPAEQAAIIEFMTVLEAEHAWPTEKVVEALQKAWSSQR